jgi:serine/threonine-protein kinase HipA
MARNYHAVIWTRVSGKPEKMGDLVLSQAHISFTYTNEYLSTGQPGFCLLGDGAIWGTDSVSYPVSERIPLFPRLLSLVPGNNPRNLQRRHYLDILRAKLGKEPPPGIDTEWQLLVMGGHGGIGHIDIFSDDIVAENWYRIDIPARDSVAMIKTTDSRSQLWRMLKRNVLDENIDFDPLVVEQTLGPTPSVGGMIPKLLVSIAPDEAEINFYPPGTKDKIDVVLKIEPPEYSGLLDLEALCLDVHREAGFEVPVYHRFDDNDLHFLAVERFDRAEGKPLPMESLFSIIATGDHHFRETGDILLDELGGILQRLAEVANLEEGSSEQLYRRILMALLTGNGDLHLDNIAILGGLSDCRLTPVYDPAPMRAWPRHNLVSAIPFEASAYQDHGAFFVALGRSFGLSADKVKQCIQDALATTSTYAERVMQLQRLSLLQRNQLVEIVKNERFLLQKNCT